VNRKFDRVKASYQEVYNDMLQYIFTVTGLYTINMKIKCKSNKFNEFNRYGSDEKNSTLVIVWCSSILTESGNTFYEVLCDDGIIRKFVSERFYQYQIIENK
jgi:hypothetical protein